MPVSEAQKRATIKYQNAKYDRITVCLPKGARERIAAVSGEAINAYAKTAIMNRLAADEKKAQQPEKIPFELSEEITLDDMFE